MRYRPFIFLVLLLAVGLFACSDQPASRRADGSKATVPKSPEFELAKLTNRAQAGDAVFQLQLGDKYAKGDGVPKDATKAAEWYQKAAEQGNADAQWRLGRLYYDFECAEILDELECNGVPEDAAKAAEWYLKAAEQGNVEAQFQIGFMYFEGRGVNEDWAKALPWLEKAAGQDHALAHVMIGSAHKEGNGVPKDAVKGAEFIAKGAGLLQQQAEQGNIIAHLLLAILYDKGSLLPKDVGKAIEWYQKAAEKGSLTAQISLGEKYAKGDGVLKDATKADEWFQKAAALGGVAAQISLGEKYAMGYGVPKDAAKAIEWYLKAAEKGNADVQLRLGNLYKIQKDNKQALEWYRTAAEQGNADAQYKLGNMYAYGKGVPRDYAEAVKWYRKAAEQGVASAQDKLGDMYADGKGVPQDYILAYAWLNLAAAQGQFYASEIRDSLADIMTPAQIAEAQKLSAQLQQEINRPSAPSDSKERSPKTSGIPARQVKGSGSGFIITKDGYVLTCQHVIDNAESIEVAIEDNVYPAKLIREDKYNDLALLKISGTFPPLAFCSKRSAQMGQEVFTIGYPNPILQGISAKLTKGTVASLTGFQDDLRLYQISVPVQPGNSGGPLLDLSGDILGVIVAILDAKTAFDISGSLPQNVNYAVKGAYAQALLGTLPEVSEKLSPPYRDQPFADVVNRVNKSVVMVLIY